MKKSCQYRFTFGILKGEVEMRVVNMGLGFSKSREDCGEHVSL